MSNPKLYTLTDPLDMEDARAAYKRLGDQRRDARKDYEHAVTEAAVAEREYRKGLAQAFVSAEGDTAAKKEADARARVADLSYTRDLKRGMVKAQEEKLNEIDAVRASLHRLCEWSMKIDPLGMEDRSSGRGA